MNRHAELLLVLGRYAEVSDLLSRNRVVGFSTSGEQYQAMHLNHTFVGLAFKRPDRRGP